MPKSSNSFKTFFKHTKSKKVIFIFLCSTRGCVVIEDAEEIVAEQGPKQFSFKTLSSATEGFHAKNKLGKGGFAQVYKGKLNDGREIAVKRPLLISDKGTELVLNEMKLLLGSAHHRNIVKFLGFCSHREEMLLVFDFARNGSLDYLLFNSKTGRANTLDWKQTYAIIIGVARGLLYLHERSHSVIIHCDIKPANIIIDENWVPKIADFGTAMLFPQDQTHVNISEAAVGYAAPEYQNYGHISPKADVYSFGVVVLELTSGQKYWLSHAQSSNAQGLRDSANELYKEGKVSQFMDQKLIPSAVLDQVQLCVQIGVMCTQFDPELRPTMGRVYSMLSENYSSSSSTLVEEPMRDGSSSSSSSSSTAGISGRKELGNNGSSSGTDIHLENEGLPIHRRLTRSRRIQPEDVQSYILSISGSSCSSIGPTELANNGSSSGADIHLENEDLPKHRRLTRSRRIQPEDVQSYIPSIPSSSCNSSGNGTQIEPDEGPVQATIQEVATAPEKDEGGIPIPMITKEDPIETMGKLCPRKTLARQSREKTPLPPPHMTKQTKEATKKVAKQQQTVEEEIDEKRPTTLNDTEERPVNSTPEDRVVIMPEIKVDKERLATNDKEDFLNDEGNKSSWCEESFFEEGEEGKYKDQLTNPQYAIFTNNGKRILRKVGVAEDSLLFFEVPLPGLVEQQLPTAEEAVDDGDHGGGSVADSNG
ncbi:unnamed protein product [Camellia sinensis]